MLGLVYPENKLRFLEFQDFVVFVHSEYKTVVITFSKLADNDIGFGVIIHVIRSISLKFLILNKTLFVAIRV